MDFTIQYCQTRRTLEERGWALASRLSRISSQLITSAGIDHKIFNTTVAECKEIQVEIKESRQKLQDHRFAHGC